MLQTESMKRQLYLLCILVNALTATAQLQISSYSQGGDLTVSDVFTNGVCTMLRADTVDGTFRPVKNIFTTSLVAQMNVAVTGAVNFYQAKALDLSSGREGFTNLTAAYGLLTTIAGAGGPQDVNNWLPQYEGGPATTAVLSAPHIAIANRAGEIYHRRQRRACDS